MSGLRTAVKQHFAWLIIITLIIIFVCFLTVIEFVKFKNNYTKLHRRVRDIELWKNIQQ